MQRAPAAGGDPFHELVCTGPARMHRTQQATVGHARGAAEHARRIRRAADDIAGGAARRGPRRRGRHQDIDDEGGEREGDEPADEGRPLGSVAQPEHTGDRIREHKERHVDAADEDFPPRWLSQLDVFLQPYRRDRAEEQPAVGVRLELPQGPCAEHVGCAAAEVVKRQHQRERQPIADDSEHLVSATDARGNQPGGDVEQQQLTVERQPIGHASVDHHHSPGDDGGATHPPEPTVSACRVVLRRGGRRESRELPDGRVGLGVTLEQPDSSIGGY